MRRLALFSAVAATLALATPSTPAHAMDPGAAMVLSKVIGVFGSAMRPRHHGHGHHGPRGCAWTERLIINGVPVLRCYRTIRHAAPVHQRHVGSYRLHYPAVVSRLPVYRPHYYKPIVRGPTYFTGRSSYTGFGGHAGRGGYSGPGCMNCRR